MAQSPVVVLHPTTFGKAPQDAHFLNEAVARWKEGSSKRLDQISAISLPPPQQYTLIWTWQRRNGTNAPDIFLLAKGEKKNLNGWNMIDIFHQLHSWKLDGL